MIVVEHPGRVGGAAASALVARMAQHAYGKTLERGAQYARDGRITDLAHDETRATARVRGTDPDPYEVVLERHAGGWSADCDCPAADSMPWCKHAVAVGFALADQISTGDRAPHADLAPRPARGLVIAPVAVRTARPAAAPPAGAPLGAGLLADLLCCQDLDVEQAARTALDRAVRYAPAPQ